MWLTVFMMFIGVVVFFANGIVGVFMLGYPSFPFRDFLDEYFPESNHGMLSCILVVQLWPIVIGHYLYRIVCKEEFLAAVKKEVSEALTTLKTLCLGK